MVIYHELFYRRQAPVGECALDIVLGRLIMLSKWNRIELRINELP